MSCLCFNNCLFRRKDDTKLLMQTNIQDIKQKQRSVFKAPRSHSKKQKKTTKSSSTIKKTTTPEWKNKFRCLFCGGKKCSSENYLNNPNSAIKGLNCDIIDNDLYAGQRPCSFLIEKFNLIDSFKVNNIGLIVNLQRQGEHPSCGPGELDMSSGYSYNPNVFMKEGINVKLAEWREYTSSDSMSYVLDVVKSISFTVKIEHKKVYIHCHNGNNRSGIIVACYFMYNKNITSKEAVDLAKHYRQKFFSKLDEVKYVDKFEIYLTSIKELFPNEKLPIVSYLKNQWKIDYKQTKSYIPILLNKCLTKLITVKSNPNRPYSNNAIYKALNGSLEITDEVFIQIKHIIKTLNTGDWKEFDECSSTVIISEILFFWLDESVKYCVNPLRIIHLINNASYANKIDMIVNGKCSKIEQIYEVFSLVDKNLKKIEIEVLQFVAEFLEKIYPLKPSTFSNQSSKTFEIRPVRTGGTSFSKDNSDEYERALEKLSIYLIGFNIDMLCNEEVIISESSNNINDHTEISKSFGSPIEKESEKEVSLIDLMHNTMKLIEFFRIFLLIKRNSNNDTIKAAKLTLLDDTTKNDKCSKKILLKSRNENKEENNNESSLHCGLKYYLSSSFDSSSQEEKEINISGDNLLRITKRAITETQIEWKLQKCKTKRRSIYYTNDGTLVTLVNLLKTKTNNNLCCYDYSRDYFNRKRNTVCLLRPIAHPSQVANKNNVIKKEK